MRWWVFIVHSLLSFVFLSIYFIFSSLSSSHSCSLSSFLLSTILSFSHQDRQKHAHIFCVCSDNAFTFSACNPASTVPDLRRIHLGAIKNYSYYAANIEKYVVFYHLEYIFSVVCVFNVKMRKYICFCFLFSLSCPFIHSWIAFFHRSLLYVWFGYEILYNRAKTNKTNRISTLAAAMYARKNA